MANCPREIRGPGEEKGNKGRDEGEERSAGKDEGEGDEGEVEEGVPGPVGRVVREDDGVHFGTNEISDCPGAVGGQ